MNSLTRRALVPLLCLAANTAFAGIVGAAPDAVYSNAEYRFSFKPPAGWEEKKHPEALVVYMEPVATTSQARPKKETAKELIARLNKKLQEPAVTTAFRCNITVTARDSGGMTAKEYAKETRGRAALGKSYRIIGEVPGKLGGEPSVVRTVRLSFSTSQTIQTREVFCVRNGKLITLTLAAPTARFSTFAGEFDKVVASFVWR
jgi:hypothetical protein